MKLHRKRISQHYQSVQEGGRRHMRRRPYIFPIFGLFLGGAIVAAAILTNGNQTFRPSDSHVVFLFDNGKQETLDTKAATVGQLVKDLPLNLIPQDVIEPAGNTPIVEDNFRVNIYRARPVTVVDGGQKTVTLTAQKSPRDVAEEAGLKINPEDIATFAQGSVQQNIIGEQVIVTRATAVTLNLYGTQLPTHTLAKTVDGFLKEKKIQLSGGETVSPAASMPISPGLQIFVLRKGSQVTTIEQTIPIPIQTVNDPTLSFGTNVVRQNGSPGKEADTYIINSQDGKETSRQLIQQVVIVAAVPQIVAHGTTIDVSGDKSGLMAAAGISSSDYGYVNYIISRESGWCPTKAQGEYGDCQAYHGVPDYGGYGLGQATPGAKMASAGADWATNPVTQLKWCDGYADSRYGGWYAAYEHWAAYHNW